MKQFYYVTNHLSALICRFKIQNNRFIAPLIMMLYIAFAPSFLVGQNVTDPGEIGGGIESCGTVDPPAMTSVSPASGGDTSVAIEYQFQSRNKTACAVVWGDWGNVTGVLSSPIGYDPGSWNRDREVRRGARRAGFTEFIWSNVVTVEILNPLTDTGSISGDFSGAAFSDPPATVNVTSPSDSNCGELLYRWQVRERIASGATWPGDEDGWTDLFSEDSATIDPSPSGVDRQYRRGARINNCGDWQRSNIITIDVDPIVIVQITDPGEIGGGIESCGTVDPPAMTSVSPASGGTAVAPIEYQFQSRNKTACATVWEDWVNVTGVLSTSTGYDPGSWNRDREVRRGARRAGLTEFVWSNVVTIEILNPLTDTGSISGNFSGCSTEDPPVISNVVFPADSNCGELLYRWQVRERSACATTWPADEDGWTDLFSEDQPTLDPGVSTMDRQYRRGARINNCGDWQRSNIVTIDVYESDSTDSACNCDALSVNEYDVQNHVRIFPNPTTSFINIQVLNNSTLKSISVYSITGKTLIFSKAINPKLSVATEKISTKNWVSGIYIVKIETDKFVNQQKIIVN